MFEEFFRPWMKTTLKLAAIYNILWGAYAVLAPVHFFTALGMDAPNYPGLWQCIGMIVGVYGIGYWIAADNPLTHWPIVLVGLLGKIFGPIGFAINYSQGKLPLEFGSTIITNDLIWLIPFTLILKAAYRKFIDEEAQDAIDLFDTAEEALEKSFTQNMDFLRDITYKQPVLLVLLRHKGCTFCREALSDLQQTRAKIEEKGIKIVVVHMNQENEAIDFFSKYKLDDLDIISDPNRILYKSLGVKRGSLTQLFGLKVWFRFVIAGIFKGHGHGGSQGDVFQMPGMFLLKDGTIQKVHFYDSAATRPDYFQFVSEI
jgi:peroxiredoxin